MSGLGSSVESASSKLSIGRRRSSKRVRVQKAKDEFLSLAAHEMRTPITVIKAQAQLAERFHAQGKFEGEVVGRSLRVFVQEADRLAKLCNDLLDIARMDAGSFELHLVEFDLAWLVREVTGRLFSRLDRHQFEVDCSKELWVVGDRERTEQVLLSLLGNAIRYSPQGGLVRIGVKEENTMAVVRVADQGIGIPNDKIGHVFERYYQAHQSGLKGPCGLGIGLYLAREVIQRMSGTISVHSEGVDRGAEFTFTLPTVKDNREGSFNG